MGRLILCHGFLGQEQSPHLHRLLAIETVAFVPDPSSLVVREENRQEKPDGLPRYIQASVIAFHSHPQWCARIRVCQPCEKWPLSQNAGQLQRGFFLLAKTILFGQVNETLRSANPWQPFVRNQLPSA